MADSYWELFIHDFINPVYDFIMLILLSILVFGFQKQLGRQSVFIICSCMSGATISLAVTAAFFESIYGAFLTAAFIMLD